MAYLTNEELKKLGFKYLGKNVLISDKASIYDPEKIEVGDNSRIDDFCVISGSLKFGHNVYVGPLSLIAGGDLGIIFEDFTTLAYNVKIFTQSDDYSGHTLTNSTVPKKYKKEKKEAVIVKRHSIIGAGACILPGVVLETGTSIGAMSLILKSTEPWGIYAGNPAKRLKDRKKDLLQLEKQYLMELYNDQV